MLSTLRHIDLNRESQEDSTGWYVPSWMDAHAGQGNWSPLSAHNSLYDLGPSHENLKRSHVFPADEAYAHNGYGAILDDTNARVEYEAPIMREVLQLQHSKHVAAESMSTLIATDTDPQHDDKQIHRYNRDQERIAMNRVRLLNLCLHNYDERNPDEPKMKVWNTSHTGRLPVDAQDFVPGGPSFSEQKFETCITYRRFKSEDNGLTNSQEIQEPISWTSDNNYQSFFDLLSPTNQDQRITIQKLYNAGYTCPRSEQTETLLKLLSLKDQISWNKDENMQAGLTARSGPWSFPTTSFKPWHVWSTTSGLVNESVNHMVLMGPMDLNVCHEYDNPLVNKTIQEMILWQGQQENRKALEGMYQMQPSVFWNFHLKIYFRGENHVLNFCPFSKPDHCIVSHIVIKQQNCQHNVTKGILQTGKKTKQIHHKGLFGSEHERDWPDENDSSTGHAEYFKKANEKDPERDNASTHSAESDLLHAEPQADHTVEVSIVESCPYYCVGAARGHRWNEGQLSMVHSSVHRSAWYNKLREDEPHYNVMNPESSNFYFKIPNADHNTTETDYPSVKVVRLTFKNWDVMTSSYMTNSDPENLEVITVISGVCYPPHLTRSYNPHHTHSIPRNPVLQDRETAEWLKKCEGDFYVRLALADPDNDVNDTIENTIYLTETKEKNSRIPGIAALRAVADVNQLQLSRKFHDQWIDGLGFFQNISARPDMQKEWVNIWKQGISNNIRLCLIRAVENSLTGSDYEDEKYMFPEHNTVYWYTKDPQKFIDFLIPACKNLRPAIPDVEERVRSYVRHFHKKKMNPDEAIEAGLGAILAARTNARFNGEIPMMPEIPNTSPRMGETQKDAEIRVMKEYQESIWRMVEIYGKASRSYYEKKFKPKKPKKNKGMSHDEMVKYFNLPIVEHEEEQMDIRHLEIQHPELRKEISKIHETNEIRIPMFRETVPYVIGYMSLKCQRNIIPRRLFIKLVDEWAKKFEEIVHKFKQTYKNQSANMRLPDPDTFDEIMCHCATHYPTIMHEWTHWWYARILRDISQTVRYIRAVERSAAKSATKNYVGLWVIMRPQELDESSPNQLTWDDILEFGSGRFTDDKLEQMVDIYRELVNETYGADHLVASDDDPHAQCQLYAKNTASSSGSSISYLHHKPQWDALQERIKQMETRLSGTKI